MAISGIYLPSVYAPKIYYYGHDASAPTELVTGSSKSVILTDQM